jgi:predicted transcriptional regulator
MVFEERRNRDRLFILAEILEIAKEGTLKTSIMYRASLSYTQLMDYMSFMLKVGLLMKVLENNKEVYKATLKGMDFLQRYIEITELLRLEQSEYEEETVHAYATAKSRKKR